MFRDPITFSFRDQDYFGIVLVLVLLVFGGFVVNSATGGTRLAEYGTREWVYVGLSLAVFALALYIPYTMWVEYGYILYGIICFILMVLPLFGKTVAGSKSWMAVGSLGFQPSELAKAVTILALASFVRDEETHSYTIRDFAILFAIIMLPFALTMLQPDFGTALTFLPLVAAVLFFSDLKLKSLLKWGVIALGAGVVLFCLAWFTFFKPYQKERIMTFLNPGSNPQGAGYQVNQAKIAVGSGKFYGKGLHSGTQNRLSFLPAPHTDFIFAVVAEELGFVGSFAVLFMFLLLLSKFLTIGEQSTTREGSFIALGVFMLFLLHITVNIAMVLGLFPTMGIPLPFLSYGGSFLVTVSFLSGLVLNVGSRPY